jgi:N-methylhydantoinase B
MSVLNRAIEQSDNEFVRDHAMAPFQDVWPVAAFYGVNQYGDPDIHIDMNGGGAGGGAMAVKDGLNCSGILAQLNNQLPDIERNEDDHPQLYLWRRLNRNSGGPGEHRGGLGQEYAWTLHKSPGGEQTVTTAAAQVPISGVSGGYPGGTNVFELVQESNVDALLEEDHVPSTLDELDGSRRETEAKEMGDPVGPSTVLANQMGGGSGVGDPIKRPPETVRDDLAEGRVTADVAANVYGVVVEDGAVQPEETATRREEIRAERTAWPVESEFAADHDSFERVRPYGRYLAVVESGAGEQRALRCTDCETVFAPIDGPADLSWTRYTATNDSPVVDRFESLGLYVQEREGPESVHLLEHACPDCGVLCHTTVEVRE